MLHHPPSTSHFAHLTSHTITDGTDILAFCMNATFIVSVGNLLCTLPLPQSPSSAVVSTCSLPPPSALSTRPRRDTHQDPDAGTLGASEPLACTSPRPGRHLGGPLLRAPTAHACSSRRSPSGNKQVGTPSHLVLSAASNACPRGLSASDNYLPFPPQPASRKHLDGVGARQPHVAPCPNPIRPPPHANDGQPQAWPATKRGSTAFQRQQSCYHVTTCFNADNHGSHVLRTPSLLQMFKLSPLS